MLSRVFLLKVFTSRKSLSFVVDWNIVIYTEINCMLDMFYLQQHKKWELQTIIQTTQYAWNQPLQEKHNFYYHDIKSQISWVYDNS